MNSRFRLYRRNKGGRYYIHDSVTRKQESLGTSDAKEAETLLHVVHQELEARIRAQTVELFHQGKRVAAALCSSKVVNLPAASEILDHRHGVGATLITSQFPVNQWHEFP